jgi:hypothetical protein
MQIHNPFARAKAMFGLIAAAMAMGSLHLQQAALAQIDPYVSRGKGKGKAPIGRKGGHKAAVRAATKARNSRRHRAASR